MITKTAQTAATAQVGVSFNDLSPAPPAIATTDQLYLNQFVWQENSCCVNTEQEINGQVQFYRHIKRRQIDLIMHCQAAGRLHQQFKKV